jgi:ubiquinone/menaquinone biosynthesis C-methylase UbiE
MEGEQPSAAEFWRQYDAVESRLTAPLSERMLDLAGLRPGMRVLDLASGRGEPALRAAQRVGEKGFVLGVDTSETMLEMAREKARREGLSNLEFSAGNAELMERIPVAHFHAATVRWGLMYMVSPVAALASARRALVAGGVLVAALWAEPERAMYYTLPRRLLERYRTVPVVDAEAPGTFRYADVGRITQDFGRAGFIIERIEELEVPVMEAETSAALLAWVRALGLARLVNELPEDEQRAWTDELVRALEQLRVGTVIRLGGTTRLVLARSSEEVPKFV